MDELAQEQINQMTDKQLAELMDTQDIHDEDDVAEVEVIAYE